VLATDFGANPKGGVVRIESGGRATRLFASSDDGFLIRGPLIDAVRIKAMSATAAPDGTLYVLDADQRLLRVSAAAITASGR
jgi:hypothetical protein